MVRSLGNTCWFLMAVLVSSFMLVTAPAWGDEWEESNYNESDGSLEYGDGPRYTVYLPEEDELRTTFNGGVQSPWASPYRGYSVSGETSATKPGTYTVVASIQQGCEWEDGSTEDKTITWTIDKYNIEGGNSYFGRYPSVTRTIRARTASIYTGSPYVNEEFGANLAIYELEGAPGQGIASEPLEHDGSTWLISYSPVTTTDVVKYQLKRGVDYTVEWKDNVNVGMAVGTIRGIGEYCTGTLEETAYINPADIGSTEIVKIGVQRYAGKPVEPTLSLSYNGKALEKGKDYTVSYEANEVPGTAVAIVKGIGNFQGVTQSFFSIVSSDAKSIWTRLRGSTALDTMGAIVGTDFVRADAVVIATSEGFADALAASALAGANGAPILMTEPNRLSKQTADEIKRLGATKAYVVGGKYAVSDAVLDQIKAQTSCKTVDRIKGSAADDTSREIAKAVGAAASGTVIVATQLDYRDALSVSSYAYATKSPIILLDRKAKLSDANVAYLKGAGFEKAVVVGGRFAVPEAVVSQLRSAGIADTERLRGDSAYDTSVAIAEWAVGNGLSVDGMGVACGQNYPDALAGAALCGKNRSVLLLADGTNSKAAVDFARSNKAAINGGYVFGGRFAVPDAVMSAFESATK